MHREHQVGHRVAAPAHFGLGDAKKVDVEVTYFTQKGRRTLVRRNVDATKTPMVTVRGAR